MNQEVLTVISESWFTDTIRAIVAEFHLDDQRVRGARIRKQEFPGGDLIHYGRYRLFYEPLANIIFWV